MKIAVVIPCRNENGQIIECIDAINACELPAVAEIKIFVVDGMSDDGTRKTVTERMDSQKNLFLVDNVKQLTPYAFNLGIHAFPEADYVQIVGARHILSSNYMMECLSRINAADENWCVGGRIENEYLNETGRIIAVAMRTSLGMGIGNFRTLNESGYTDTVTSPMYPRKVFDQIGYFDEDLIRNQDDDFNYRVSKEGGKIYYENDISLRYYVRGTFSGLWRQFFQYGYWKVFVNQKHKAVTTLRQLVPPLFVAYMLLLPILTLIHPIFLLPFSLYLILVLITSILLSSKEKLPFHKLVLTYFILHFAYGFGYLKGIWEFILLRKKPSNKQKRLSR